MKADTQSQGVTLGNLYRWTRSRAKRLDMSVSQYIRRLVSIDRTTGIAATAVDAGDGCNGCTTQEPHHTRD